MTGRVLIRLTAVLAIAPALSAQSFDTTVGSSEMYGSSGLYTEYHRGDAYGWAGIGYSNGFQYGSFYSTPIAGFGAGAKAPRLGIGDQSLPAFLDVDEYDSHRFTVRGASFVRKSNASLLEVFGGALTEDTIQPYLHFAATSGTSLSNTPLGAVTYWRKVSPAIQLHSLNLFTDKVTTIQSVGWKPSKEWQFAGAGGLGLGAPYLSAVSEYNRKLLDLRASYTLADHNFHREEGPYSSNENLGLNARADVTPGENFKFGVAHEHQLTYMPEQLIPGQPAQPAATFISTFDSAHLFAALRGFRVSASASTGKEDNATGMTTTELLTVSRRMTFRWTTFGSVISMKTPLGDDRAYIDINEFKMSPRLALRQNYTWMTGQNSFSLGGEWKSNLLSFSIDQETYVSPLAAAIGKSGMFQAWTFSIRLRTPHGTAANMDTFVDPMGNLQWGGYLDGLRYDAVGPSAQSGPSFSRYVVDGTVVDQDGRGVWGIALSIGGETVISDDNGTFFLHVKSAKPVPLTVVPDSSLQFVRWTVASAPATVSGWLEGGSSADPVRVVVRLGASATRR
jgi:hypothetical protein